MGLEIGCVCVCMRVCVRYHTLIAALFPAFPPPFLIPLSFSPSLLPSSSFALAFAPQKLREELTKLRRDSSAPAQVSNPGLLALLASKQTLVCATACCALLLTQCLPRLLVLTLQLLSQDNTKVPASQVESNSMPSEAPSARAHVEFYGHWEEAMDEAW